VEIRARLVREPDVLSGGIAFGPRLMVGDAALRASGLLQPGSLVRWTYRLALPEDRRSDAALQSAIRGVRTALPDAGFEVRTRTEAAPQLESNIDRFTQFLTIIGLTALIVGGVGVANAVNAYVDRKRESIATLKTLGATGGRVFSIYLAEIVILALLGTGIGLVVGAALPFITVWGFGAVLPLPITPAVYWRELLLALAYGLLTALTFALWPLGKAHDVSVATLYRERVAPTGGWPRRRYVVATVVAACALAALAVFAAYDRRIALVFAGAALAIFIALRLVALAIMAGARRLPRPRSTELRLALTNLYRPGALTPSVVLSLGLGLALLVALTLIDASVRHQLEEAMPAEAPSFYFVDVPSREGARLDALIGEAAPKAKIERVPMLRGTITRVKGVPAVDVKVDPEMAWALRGDRGVTYAKDVPENSTVVAGNWWPADYSGPPLVSFEDRFANALGLKVGDEVTINVLGRTITAKVANLRDVRWRSLAINFFMIFSPSTFAGAPHMDLATVTYPGAVQESEELGLLKRVTDAFPMITSVRVKEALAEVDALVADLALAIRAASSVTLIASILVLAGALAAGHRHRLYDAVVLKTVGATRGRLIRAYALEYGLVGGITAIFGLLAGTLAAWVVAREVMRIDFAFDPAAILVAFGALVLTIGLGLIGTWRILGEKPARHLRAL
jgi:putative ABC transport system permease protein